MLSCDESAVLEIVLLLKNIINLIRIAAPIILIILISFDIFKLVASSLDANQIATTKKSILNKSLAMILLFLVPTLLNIAMRMLNQTSIESTACWINANKEYILKLKEEEEKYKSEKSEAERLANEQTLEQKRKESLAIRNALKDQINFGGNSDINGGGVLIIAGHCYSPECLASGDCRGYTDSGYAEEVETRSLALSLKSALLSKGVNAVIANQVLVGNESDERMDASFYGSRKGVGSYANIFSELNSNGYWESFSHVVEIHFNAANKNASGTVLMTSGGATSEVLDIDMKILNAVSKYTGNNRGVYGFSSGGLGNWEFFRHQKNKPMTYIEIEFYDNKSAMDRYKSNQEAIANEVATEIAKIVG